MHAQVEGGRGAEVARQGGERRAKRGGRVRRAPHLFALRWRENAERACVRVCGPGVSALRCVRACVRRPSCSSTCHARGVGVPSRRRSSPAASTPAASSHATHAAGMSVSPTPAASPCRAAHACRVRRAVQRPGAPLPRRTRHLRACAPRTARSGAGAGRSTFAARRRRGRPWPLRRPGRQCHLQSA
jgi:hypothetical protein